MAVRSRIPVAVIMDRDAAINALHRGTPLAAELICGSPKRRAWIGVYPLDLSSENTRQFLRNIGIDLLPKSGRVYHLRAFEVDSTIDTNSVSIGETDLLHKRSSIAFNDDDLCEQLKTFGSLVEHLEPHYKSHYPI